MTQFNMIEPSQGPDPKRLLLAVLATSSVLMVYSYFFTPTQVIEQPADPAKEVAVVNEAGAEAEAKAARVRPTSGAINAFATKPDIAILEKSFSVLEGEESHGEKRSSYRAHVSSLGGILDGFALTGFSKDRVLFSQGDESSYLLSLVSKNNFVSLDKDSRYQIVSETESEILLRHVSNEGLQVDRKYRFLTDGHVAFDLNIKNVAANPIKVDLSLGAQKLDQNGSEPSMLNPGVSGKTIAVKTQEKHQKVSYADLEDEKTFSDIKYVAFDDQFFLTAIVPKNPEMIDYARLKASKISDDAKKVEVDLVLKPFILVAGEEKTLGSDLYLGPKQVGLLSAFSTPLDENIDFGWFGVLSRPMLWLLVQIYNVVQNYGWAIILITFIIKLLTYPLTQKSYSSQQEMKKMQPKIKELQAKYGHDQTLLGQKQMELYRTHGINPVAGCLPLLVQLPIWFAFFQMLRNSVELYDQPFYFWITDLTLPDQYFILPVLMGLSMLIQQAFTPPPDQPQMKYVMWGMPIFLTFIMLNMPCGLSLYILTNNLLTIVQQIIIKKQSEKKLA